MSDRLPFEIDDEPNWDDVKTVPDILPQGVYPAIVTDIERKENKAKTGYNGEFTFTIQGSYESWDNPNNTQPTTTLENYQARAWLPMQSKKSQWDPEGKRWQKDYKKLMEALPDVDWSKGFSAGHQDAINCPITLYIEVEEMQEKNEAGEYVDTGVFTNRITKYAPYEED